jgi:hypothetical protein
MVFLTMALAGSSSAQTAGDQGKAATEKGDVQDNAGTQTISRPKCTFDVKKHKVCPTGKALKTICPGEKNWVFVRCQ